MENPFPGMNPWLEHPALWSDVHFRLISAIARYLSPLVSPRYYISVGTQAYIVTSFISSPGIRYLDVAVIESHIYHEHPSKISPPETMTSVAEPLSVQVPVPEVLEETYLEVRETETEQLITIIELLSPTNKRPGVGRQKYEQKRLEIISTFTHLVEIDLLRTWEPMPVVGYDQPSHYRILVRRGEQGSTADLYPFTIYESIPEFPVPLQVGDVEPILNVNTLLDEIYREARYDIRINYHQPPKPPLSKEEAKWAEDILASAVQESRNDGQ